MEFEKGEFVRVGAKPNWDGNIFCYLGDVPKSNGLCFASFVGVTSSRIKTDLGARHIILKSDISPCSEEDISHFKKVLNYGK